jgi:hypothetical protein
LGSWSCKNAGADGQMSGFGMMAGSDYARIAIMSGRGPIMFIRRVRL